MSTRALDLSWDERSRNGLLWKCTKTRRQPRCIIRYEATGESMPPETSETSRPLAPTGRPPGPGSLCRLTKALDGRISTDTVNSGRVRSTRAPSGPWTRAPQLAVDVVGGQRKTFVHPPGLDSEGVEGLSLEGFQDVCAKGRHVGVGTFHQGEVGDAEDPPEPLRQLVVRYVVVEVEKESRGSVADLLEAHSAQGGAEVLFEMLDEPGAVAAFEGDLVVSDQGRAHVRKIADPRNFCMESPL